MTLVSAVHHDCLSIRRQSLIKIAGSKPTMSETNDLVIRVSRPKKMLSNLRHYNDLLTADISS